MANPEHVAKLKEGVKAWNVWCSNHPDRSNLGGAILERADLQGAILEYADLRGAKLREANLWGANLRGADLSRANLNKAILIDADFAWANLSYANIRGAELKGANLTGANFTDAKLNSANLTGANLNGANLSKTELKNATFDGTILANLDISIAKNVDKVKHSAPSSIGIDTLYKSKGQIPEEFLRGAGVPEEQIGHFLSVIRSVEPVKFYSCFISYSSADDDFASRLYAKMHDAHLRVWKASEDLKIGDEFRDVIDRAIRVRDKLLITLSETSIESRWVKDEVETALDEERERKTAVLFPIRIDDAVDRETASSERRATYVQNLSGAGPARIMTLATQALVNADSDLGAAVLLEAQSRRPADRPFNLNKFAARMLPPHVHEIRKKLLVLEAVRDRAQIALGRAKGGGSPNLKLVLGLRRRKREKLAEEL